MTPAEQMRRIRQAVHATESDVSKDAYAILASYFSRLDVLRKRTMELESKMLLEEQPFVSHTPLIGPLIAGLRSVWNWMSTKWYVLPLIEQQTAFNMAATQTLRETIASLESLSTLVQNLQMRLAEIEEGKGGQASTSQEQD